MIDELGQFALVLGFCLSLAQARSRYAGRPDILSQLSAAMAPR